VKSEEFATAQGNHNFQFSIFNFQFSVVSGYVRTFHKGMTVAGTAQDSHLIPFYAGVEHPVITKTAAKLHIIF
jgi:hypothetical protein